MDAATTQEITGQNYSTLAALIVLAWDYVDTVQHEAKFVWSQPRSAIKFAFFYSRYFGLAAQITNYVVSMTRMAEAQVPHDACKAWYVFQMAAVWSLYFCVDIVLMLRVFSLYKYSYRIGAVLFTLLLIELIVVVVFNWRAARQADINSLCVSYQYPPDIILVALPAIVTQTILLLFVHVKRNIDERIHIAKIIKRDSRLAWFFVCGAMISSSVRAYVWHNGNPHMVFSWPTTVYSACACRLVINLQEALNANPYSRTPTRTPLTHSSTRQIDLPPGQRPINSRVYRLSNPDTTSPTHVTQFSLTNTSFLSPSTDDHTTEERDGGRHTPMCNCPEALFPAKIWKREGHKRAPSHLADCIFSQPCRLRADDRWRSVDPEKGDLSGASSTRSFSATPSVSGSSSHPYPPLSRQSSLYRTDDNHFDDQSLHRQPRYLLDLEENGSINPNDLDLNSDGDNSHIEIGSLHFTNESMNSEEYREYWNELNEPDEDDGAVKPR